VGSRKITDISDGSTDPVSGVQAVFSWVITDEGGKTKIQRIRGRGVHANPNLYNVMQRKTHGGSQSTAIYIVKEKKTDISLVLPCNSGRSLTESSLPNLNTRGT
jgi:hypothetical protein